MFNVTVLRMKDIVKYLVGITLTIILVITVSKTLKARMTNKINNYQEKTLKNISILEDKSLLTCFKKVAPSMERVKTSENKEEIVKENILQGMLKTQISSIQNVKNDATKVAKLEDNIKNQEISNITDFRRF